MPYPYVVCLVFADMIDQRVELCDEAVIFALGMGHEQCHDSTREDQHSTTSFQQCS
jgi:hypothetical protein